MIHYSIMYPNTVTRHEYYDDSVLDNSGDMSQRKPQYVCYEYPAPQVKNVKRLVPPWVFQKLLVDDDKDLVMIKDPAGINTGDVLDLVEFGTHRILRCVVTGIPSGADVLDYEGKLGIIEVEVIGEKTGIFRRKEE